MSIARRLAVLAAAAAAVLVPTAPAVAAQAPDVHAKIIDGREVDSAPWAARLFSDGRETCTATIIAPEWVLTAQHCVAGGGQLTFHIGDVDQTKGEQAAAKPGGVHIHDTADLALVNLDHPVQTQYSPLGEPGAVRNGQTVQTYGWGATCTDQPEINCQSKILKVADVRVTDVACSDYRGGTAVCATRGDGIPAGGDSGGPMFAGGVQVGVASTSDRQSNTAYANLTGYREWIKSVAGV